MLSEAILRAYGQPVFVETGSHVGTGIAMALDCGVKEVWSAEILDDYANICRARFSQYENVNIWHGHSVDMLRDVLPRLAEPAFIWLDAHDNDVATGPLAGELEIIKQAEIRHVIAVDDLCLLGLIFGGGVEDLKECISLGGAYEFSIENCCRDQDVLVAVPYSMRTICPTSS